MGSAVLSRAGLNGTLSEVVGYKAGLALNEEQLAAHVIEDYRDYILGDPEKLVRVRSEEAEEIVAQILHGVGRTPVPYKVTPIAEVVRKFSRRRGGIAAINQFQRIMLTELQAQENDAGPVDFTPVIVRAQAEMGDLGAAIAMMYYEMLQLSFEQSLWTKIRRVDWKNVAQLDDLFKSESLLTPYGSYIDQRFIDYLAQNVPAIDEMNWRKFEGLTCEFFERSGYRVEIAEGRNDGGIDARVWSAKPTSGDPPTILVQCKRQKHKVEKVVVKALWADVVDEGAESGLVVTSSALSPGAAAVCSARGYPVDEANRETIRAWLEAMRSPNTGVFLGL